MFNSNELCLPLCAPFACGEADSRNGSFPEEALTNYFAEMVLLRQGRVRVSLEQEERVVSSGEAIFVCPGVRHQMAAEGEEPVVMDIIRLDPDRMPEMPAYAPELKSILMEAVRERMPMVVPAAEALRMGLGNLMTQCIRESRERGFGYDVSIISLLGLVCVAMIRFWMAAGLVLKDRAAQPETIESLSGYIQRHLRENLRVEELAERCSMSYPWFAKRFRQIYGVNCKDFIEQIRVDQVEKFLLFTEMDLESISEETGYADCSHMIKNFKRIKGITPGQYRLRRR